METAVKFIYTTSTKLSQLAIKDGQIIALTDTGQMYYDTGTTRQLSNKKYTDEAMSELAAQLTSHSGDATIHFTEAERTKLSGIASGANKTTVDSALSTTSTNPVQNKVIKAAIDELGKSVADGKQLLAETISNTTGMLSPASDYTFAELSEGIELGIESLSRYRYNEGYSEGYDAGETATKKGTATAAQVLTGYTFTNASSIGASGTMPNNGAVSQSLNCGGSYTIPAGYHSGSGKVTANSLASQTSATATAAQILSGATAWVNGSKLTGTLASSSGNSVTSTSYIGGNTRVFFPIGYYNHDTSINAGFGYVLMSPTTLRSAADAAGVGYNQGLAYGVEDVTDAVACAFYDYGYDSDGDAFDEIGVDGWDAYYDAMDTAIMHIEDYAYDHGHNDGYSEGVAANQTLFTSGSYSYGTSSATSGSSTATITLPTTYLGDYIYIVFSVNMCVGTTSSNTFRGTSGMCLMSFIYGTSASGASNVYVEDASGKTVKISWTYDGYKTVKITAAKATYTTNILSVYGNYDILSSNSYYNIDAGTWYSDGDDDESTPF